MFTIVELLFGIGRTYTDAFISNCYVAKKKTLFIALPNATPLCLNMSKRSCEEAREVRIRAKIDSSLESELGFG